MAYGKKPFVPFNATKGKGKKKYSNSEQIAFRMGQEDRVRQSLKSNPNSRVVDAYNKGLQGSQPTNKKPLF